MNTSEPSSAASGERRLLLWAPVVVLLAYEFYLSSQSHLPSLPLQVPQADKLAHVTYFFLTGAFAVRAARFGEGWGRRKTAVGLLAGATLWAILDEFHQSFVPNRNVEVADVVADVFGCLLAVLFAERFWCALRFNRAIH